MSKKRGNINKRKNDVGKKKCASVYAHGYEKNLQKLQMQRTEKCAFKGLSFENAAQEWLDDVKIRVKESTHANYTYLLIRHILPVLGRKQMSALCSADINRFIREKSENGRLKREGGISNKYLQDIVSVVKSIVAYCEQEHGIPDRIRHIHPPRPEKHERPVLEKAEQDRLTKMLLSSVSLIYLGVLLALYAGLRIGEVCGLRWEDYDADSGLLYIRRTVQRICDNKGGSRLHVGTPKTQSSVRTVPLPLKLCELMSELKGKDDEYIISGTTNPPEPSQLRKSFIKLLLECNLPEIRFHDLRHIFASNCVKLNFDIKSLSEIMGHSDVAMTLNRYVHTNIETKRNFMRAIQV